MTCPRCQGFITSGYDSSEREPYLYCFNCGHRPMVQLTRGDGLPLDAALLCVVCKERPRMMTRDGYARATETERSYCLGCFLDRSERRAESKARRLAKLGG